MERVNLVMIAYFLKFSLIFLRERLCVLTEEVLTKVNFYNHFLLYNKQ